ncbi:hypothetical protein D7Y27_07795 [Corallococcus sp. AB004]|nr:hypothetical protein D7Y27_07795 [Corallococcus sp. AB004]
MVAVYLAASRRLRLRARGQNGGPSVSMRSCWLLIATTSFWRSSANCASVSCRRRTMSSLRCRSPHRRAAMLSSSHWRAFA